MGMEFFVAIGVVPAELLAYQLSFNGLRCTA